MFNNQLLELDFSENDIDIYLKSLIAVACADDNIHEKEKDFINMQAQLLSIDPVSYWEVPEHDLSFLEKVEISKLCGLSIIRDCIVLGYIDSEFDDKEREKVFSIANKLQLQKDDVNNIENWLKELWSVIEKGNLLFK